MSEGDSDRRDLKMTGIVSLLLVYVLWGSTYLAIRVAVREGAGWEPFWLGASRVLVAAALLFLINWMRRVRLRPTAAELAVAAASGAFLWLGGNGAVMWAEQNIDSSLAALIIGTTPMWTALFEAVLDRKPPSLLLAGSLVTGFVGLVVLTSPLFDQGLSGDALAVLAVMLACISWACGTILLDRKPVGLDPIVVSGWQHLAGGVGFVILALLAAERLPTPTATAWAAWAYLVVFGSMVAFTAFVVALKHLPTGVVMTYAYVNPVIAVILGRMILSEPVTPATVIGTALIVSGVWGVFRDKRPKTR